MGPATDERITWVRGERRAGPNEMIGVLELKVDGSEQLLVVELPRERAGELVLEAGEKVWAVARDVRLFPADYQI